MDTPDFLIIGGGIIGCCLARELARASKRVTLLDSGPIGGGASPAAAGLLSPNFGAATADALVDLCYRSAEQYESWINELRDEGAGDVGFRRLGFLDVWTNETQAARERSCHAGRTRPGRQVELLSGAEVRRREPALAPQFPGATLYPDDAQVDAALLMPAVAWVAQRAGVLVQEYEVIRRLVREGDRVSAVHTDRCSYRPGVVVLCAGAWSGQVAALLGLELPTRPVKGQLLTADCRVSPVRAPVNAGDALFVPRPDGRLTLGVTVEEAGYDSRVTLAGLRSILEQTCALVPEVGPIPLGHAWAGLRPATPDGWPYMGPVPPLHNFWLSTGHFRKGILLAPLCARLVASSILADRPDDALLPFTPLREGGR